jgi:purine-nucleoside phosphorylase
MHSADTIVLPVCNARTPKLGPTAILVSAEEDLRALQKRLALPDMRRLYMSRIHYEVGNPRAPVLVGPMMGAPYATMLLEIVHAWGVRRALFLGWCGSIHPDLKTGDLVVPQGAFVDEGTSLHYGQCTGARVTPDDGLRDQIEDALTQCRIEAHPALIWTTDAVFRETRAKMMAFQERGARAVEMELSALLSVAAFHAFGVAAVLAVSDELHTPHWRPGFKNERFIKTRAVLTDFVVDHIAASEAWKSNLS